MRCDNAIATFFAGVNLSSPYRIIECEQSSINTVAHDDWYSHWCTCKSEYSMLSGMLSPSRWIALESVAVMSRFSVSPNSYVFDDPLASMPVARSRVSCRPKLDLPSDPRRLRSDLKPRKSRLLSVISNLACCASPACPPTLDLRDGSCGSSIEM